MSTPSSKALQELWAGAYDGWIGPPGAAEEVVYLAPVASALGDVAWPAWVERVLKLADEHGGFFSLTAFNPLGQETPHQVNLDNNMLLEEDIKRLCEEIDCVWWHSFGFASDWHEKGFSVAAPQERVLALATKYSQGAIYRFYRADRSSPASLGAPFMRATVPASLPDTEADVPVSPCTRPVLERSDPQWKPVG
eukprot:TRINITY_DN48640_c0_g1_i1.p1 TRINITY_DN48640_c0_g1~~TRINITY_DN48640_c0_g1_i1.p1  ORF type:complete len:194 (-),score=34.68 TRINITY_DN48640_c0_g1_i1:143-724(-)